MIQIQEATNWISKCNQWNSRRVPCTYICFVFILIVSRWRGHVMQQGYICGDRDFRQACHPGIRISRADAPVKSLRCNLKKSDSRLRSLVRPHLTDMAVATSWPSLCNRGWYWFSAKKHNFQPPVANSKTVSSSSCKWSSGSLLPA